MAWFKTKHPLDLPEKIDLEHHLVWIMNHFSCRLDSGAPFLTTRSPEISELSCDGEDELRHLFEFVERQLPFEPVSLAFETVSDEADLEQPPYIDQPGKIVYLRQSQLLNLEETISHIAFTLTCCYLEQLGEDGVLDSNNFWLAELIPAFFGFCILMANASFKSSNAKCGDWEYWVHIRYRNVPARIFGAMLAYFCSADGRIVSDCEDELRYDARKPFQKTLKFLSSSQDSLVSSNRPHDIFGNTDNDRLLDILVDESSSIRYAALLQIQRNIDFENDSICSLPQHGVEQLCILLRDRSDDIRYSACVILGYCEHLGKSVLLEISKLFHNKSESLRYAAVQTLANQGKDRENDPFRIQRLLNDESLPVAIAAAEAVAKMKIADANIPVELLPLLRRIMVRGSEDDAIRICGAIHTASGDALPLIESCVDSEEDLSHATNALNIWLAGDAHGLEERVI